MSLTKCVACSNSATRENSSRLNCSHLLCHTCLWEITMSTGADDRFVSVQCLKCNQSTRFDPADLPSEPKAICGEFGDLSLGDSDIDDIDWEDNSESPVLKNAPVASASAPADRIARIHSLVSLLEKKTIGKLLAADKAKIEKACSVIERNSAKNFTEIVDTLRTATHQLFDEAQLLIDRKLDYIRKSSHDLDRRSVSKREAIVSLRKTIEEMSFFNASNSEVTCLYKKVAKLHDEISNLNGVSPPFGTVKEGPAAALFFANYTREPVGSFEKIVHQTPLPTHSVSQIPVKVQPNPTPSPADLQGPPPPEKPKELKKPPPKPAAVSQPPPPPSPSASSMPPRLAAKQSNQNMPPPPPPPHSYPNKPPAPPLVKPEPVDWTLGGQNWDSKPAIIKAEPLAEKKQNPKTDAASAVKAEPATFVTKSNTPVACAYDNSMYSRMEMFAMITTLGDEERRSLQRPVGIAAIPGTKRQVAVVHNGQRVTIFTAAANAMATYIIADPDGAHRIQLVGDIAVDTDGWIYLIDRDNLPSRVFAFQPEDQPRGNRHNVVPKVFSRFSGRIRIYGLAVSSTKQTLYTSTRDAVVGFSLRSGNATFQCDLRNPSSAYIHSLFEDLCALTPNVAPFIVFTAEEGRSIHKKEILSDGNVDFNTQIVAGRKSDSPISLVRRTACDPVGNVLGADSGSKEIRVFSSTGVPVAKFAPPQSYGPAFSPSGVAVIPAHPNQSLNHANIAEKCVNGKTHLGPIVVVPDFERHRILFFDAAAN